MLRDFRHGHRGAANAHRCAYFKSFPDAHAASADMQQRFKCLGHTGFWRLLSSAARDIGEGSGEALRPSFTVTQATP